MAQYVQALLDRVYERTGKRFQPDDVSKWDVLESLGFDAKTCKEIYDSTVEPGFCAAIQAFPGAAEGVHRLRDFGDVYAVTAPFDSKYWMSEREAWLKNFGFARKNIVHCIDKHIVTGDVLVDDKTSTLVKWQEHNPLGTAILFQRSYNKNDKWSGVVVSNWPNLVSMVRDHL
jgi:5'(3')-deoxyribonucleotidase